MKQYALVLDFGTSRIHAEAIELAAGNILHKEVLLYSIHRERQRDTCLNPELVWRVSQIAVRKLLREIPVDYEPAFLSFSFAGDNFMLADKDGVPCTKIIMCTDPRGEEEAQYLRQKFGDKWIRWAGEECTKASTAARILYLKQNFPEMYARRGYFWSIQQWILFCLGLEPFNDYSMAARKVMLDNHNGSWIQELLDELEVEAGQLGNCLEAWSVIGKLTSYGEVPFPKSVPVLVGAHDCLCFLYGLGVHEDEDHYVANNSGTFDHFGYMQKGYVNHKLATADTFLASYIGADLSSHISISNTPDNGALAEWYVRKRMAGENLEAAFRKLWSQIKESDLEYKCSERDKSRGNETGFFQLMVKNTLEAKALLEDCIQMRKTKTFGVRVGGGASAATEMMQLKADIYGLPVECTNNTEVTGVGAAIIGAVATGYYNNSKEAAERMVRIVRRYEPSGQSTSAE